MPIRTNAADIAGQFTLAAARVGPLGKKTLSEVADQVKKVQESHAPRRTGKLIGAINVQIDGDGRSNTITAHIGPTGVKYATFQEHGTSRMAAHPFAEPATEEAKRLLPGAVQTMAEEAADGL